MANLSLKDRLAELAKLLGDEREEHTAAKEANLSLKDLLAEQTKELAAAKLANQALEQQRAPAAALAAAAAAAVAATTAAAAAARRTASQAKTLADQGVSAAALAEWLGSQASKCS